MKLSFGSEALADMHMQVKIGGDAALMHGLMKVQLELDAVDHEFVKQHTLALTRWSTMLNQLVGNE